MGIRLPMMVFLWMSGLACDDGPKLVRFEQTQVHMGTTFRIAFYGTGDTTARLASKAVFDRIAQLDAMMSDYSDSSELTRLSRSSGGPAQAVSVELFEVLQKSNDISKRTDGAFDVSIGPAVRLWRRARRQRQLPTEKQISRAMARVGYRKIHLDAPSRTVRLDTPAMLLDLGGIAKGYACDEAIRVLARHGIDRALVDGGGDISLAAPPPGASGWKVLVQAGDKRLKTGGEPRKTKLLRHAAIATSGDASQFVELEGKRYSHIVDPRTGVGLTTRIQVSVIAPNGATADALASAVSVLGPEKGLDVIDATPAAACLIIESTSIGLKTYRSRRWNKIGVPVAADVCGVE